MATCLDFSLQLIHFFPLTLEEVLTLLVRVLLSQQLYALGLLVLEVFQLFAVVLCLLDSLVYGDEGFIVLHFFEAGVGLDVGSLDGAVQLLIQHVHLFLVLVLQIVHFHQRVIFKLLELRLP